MNASTTRRLLRLEEMVKSIEAKPAPAQVSDEEGWAFIRELADKGFLMFRDDQVEVCGQGIPAEDEVLLERLAALLNGTYERCRAMGLTP